MLYLATVAAALAASSGYSSTSSSTAGGSTCHAIKSAYQKSACCGTDLSKVTDFSIAPSPPPMGSGVANVCADRRQKIIVDPNSGLTLGGLLANGNCTTAQVAVALSNAAEQSGTNVTKGYKGDRTASGTPISTPYYMAGLCPVNVHWHLGAEHLSVGEFDENGKGPPAPGGAGRRLAAGEREGYSCHHYDAADEKFTKPYEWKHCVGMEIGQTYEVHWPHSAMGMCGTPYQYQTPFYDGVFCRSGVLDTSNTAGQIGVQGQVFTIVNDENYYYPDLMRGMLVDHAMNIGTDIAYYTGSTTGTSRDNEICSAYSPITWQVDRKCHMISASTFDKMCADMKTQRDDMSHDLYAHGARELVLDMYAANNHATMAHTTDYHTGR